jgi:hypothetical protein
VYADAFISLIALHGWIFLCLITSVTSGYDGSMVNGLQSLPIWEADFNHPTGSKLGLLGAIQVSGLTQNSREKKG